VEFSTQHVAVKIGGWTTLDITPEDAPTVTFSGNRRKSVRQARAIWSRTLDELLRDPSYPGYLRIQWSGVNVLKDGSFGADWREEYPRLADAEARRQMDEIEGWLKAQILKDQADAVEALGARMRNIT